MAIASNSYTIDFDERPGYLYARVVAPAIDRSTAYAYLAEVVGKCSDVRQKKLLLERDIPAVLKDEEMFAAMNDLVRMSPGMRIAFVNRRISISKALEHAVTLGVEQGADYKYFTDPEEAERWLLQTD